MNFFSREQYLNQKVKFSGPLLQNSRTFPRFSRTYAFFQDFSGLEISYFRTFQGLYEPWQFQQLKFLIAINLTILSEQDIGELSIIQQHERVILILWLKKLNRLKI